MISAKYIVQAAQAALAKVTGQKSPVVLEYEKLWSTATMRPEYVGITDQMLAKFLPYQNRYRMVANTLGNGIPWWFICLCHIMEAGAKNTPFAYHLHCGDPLTSRTVNVPKGRPRSNPGGGSKTPSAMNPYSWEESALDCLINVMGYDRIKDWSIGNALWLFEKFNGRGYRRKGINTPYVWSYTNHYGTAPHTGKYVSDGKFDRNAISKQAGCAAFLIRMKEKGIVEV